MNNDAPETLAAARSRAADLEQQLKLSDEGVSRLAQRCLELEQQVLNYQAALARHGSDNEPAALTLPQLFYDSGSGYSPRECLTVAEDAYDELTHEVSAVFTLPTDARALRLDPGELACCVTDLSISDERLECRAMNGIQLQEDCLLFLDVDPNLTVQSTVPFAAGMKFARTARQGPAAGPERHQAAGRSGAERSPRAAAGRPCREYPAEQPTDRAAEQPRRLRKLAGKPVRKQQLAAHRPAACAAPAVPSLIRFAEECHYVHKLQHPAA